MPLSNMWYIYIWNVFFFKLNWAKPINTQPDISKSNHCEERTNEQQPATKSLYRSYRNESAVVPMIVYAVSMRVWIGQKANSRGDLAHPNKNKKIHENLFFTFIIIYNVSAVRLWQWENFIWKAYAFDAGTKNYRHFFFSGSMSWYFLSVKELRPKRFSKNCEWT